MGVMIDGEWQAGDVAGTSSDGEFERKATSFHDWIGYEGEFPPEADRYRLYVSYACPWAHRTLIMRTLKGLEEMIPVSVVNWYMGEGGWSFHNGPGVVPDLVFEAEFLREIYAAADDGYTGKVTVPVLLDTQTRKIVNNESSEILRMFNSAFDGLGAADGDYCPEELAGEIDEVNERVYETFNNGVYKAGFARSQRAYDKAVTALFDTMDWMEERLSRQRWLAGDRFTEADIRAFPTLIRFDPVYNCHFKCNRARVIDYPHLWAYTREIYQMPGVADTVNLQHIRHHYFESHPSVNPSGVAAIGPDLHYDAPHGRG